MKSNSWPSKDPRRVPKSNARDAEQEARTITAWTLVYRELRGSLERHTRSSAPLWTTLGGFGARLDCPTPDSRWPIER